MVETRKCPRCGDEVPADAPAGICPKCLMEEGFETTIGARPIEGELPDRGDRLGDYRIGRRLGEGGMGAVYEAEHTESGRRVALKVLNHKLQSLEHRRRFLREGRLAAAVHHPNTIYVYGTEEIDGIPVIAMELATGGTLQDRVVRHGPLPVGEAVDVILEVIAGLEAAQSAGVLHRDVKPSNCFIDDGGAVKVGDFGLSISTALRADTNLTQSGVFLGTPAFSSPEQLRGDELDVRSDIYSVGVTLFYLLTGRTPFQAKQMVQLLATVLERPAPPPAGLRSGIPSELSNVVLRCLAKQSAERFRSYSELRRALLPYTSAAPTPGTLGFRFLASAIDIVVLMFLAALLPLLWVRDFRTWERHFDTLREPGPQATSELMALSGVGMLLCLAYYAALEGIWRAAAGKAICRLRVVRLDREAPGVLRAGLRCAIFWASAWLPYWAMYAVDAEYAVAAHAEGDLTLFAASLATSLLLFATMRRRNGYAGIHDLASGTRVIRVRTHEQRPALSLDDEPLPEARVEETIGPYRVLGPVDAQTPELLLAYDTRLLRKVWVRRRAGDEPPVAPEVRGLARIGRLRWLGGERDAGGGWDAYEARRGRPLLGLIDSPQPWSSVRFWLADLAEELGASLKDGTLPPALELDRVWITEDGRAMLLDFPAPGLDSERRTESELPRAAADESTARLFLKRIAIAALEGEALSADEVKNRPVSVPLPVPAGPLLTELDGPTQTVIPTVELRSFTRRPARVSLERRVGALVVSWVFPLLFTALGLVYIQSEKRFLEEHRELGELSGFVAYYRGLQELDAGAIEASVAELRQAVEVAVAEGYRSTITDEALWSDPMTREFVDADGRRLLERFVRAHPDLAPEQVAAARAQLEPVRPQIRALGWTPEDYGSPFSITTARLALGLLVALVVVPSLISVLACRNSILLRVLEIAVVTRVGAPASRLRVLARNAILWSITLAALGALVFLLDTGRLRLSSLLILYGVVTLFTAERGLHDRLAGTWLVPSR